MALTLNETEPLSEVTKAIVKATKPVLEEHALAITARLYERLFEADPGIASMFSNDPQVRDLRLADALLAYADFIEDVGALEPVIREIAAKHLAAGVVAPQYDMVGHALLGAMVDVLGHLDRSVLLAWSDAYNYLASIFKSVEAQLLADA